MKQRLTAACSGHGLELAGLAVILGVALWLRLVGLRAGLPGPGLLSPDENTVVPRSLDILTGGTGNPHWFLYPSLYLYLVAGTVGVLSPFISVPSGVGFGSPEAYAVDPTPYILTGRAISVVAGLVLVGGTYLLGRRIAGPFAGLIASGVMAVAPIAVAYSHLAVTDMTMAALLTLGLWQLVIAAETSARRNLLWAAALIGLATSAKYNAGAAVLPLVGTAVVIARRTPQERPGACRLALTTSACWFGAFLVGTPYALLDAVRFVSDFARQNRIVANGWLGFEDVGPGWRYNLQPILSGSIGVGMLALAAVGLGLAAYRRRSFDLVLAPYAVLYFAYVSAWSAHFDRYLLPIIPVLVVLGARAAVEVGDEVAARIRLRSPLTAGALGLAVLVPAALSSATLLSGYEQRDRRLDVVPVIERVVPRGARIAVDPLGPPLVDRITGLKLTAAGHTVHWLRLIRLQTPQPGTPPDPKRSLALLHRYRVRWVLTSSDIERRIRAAPRAYPREIAFYRGIRRHAHAIYRVPASLGPGITLWDLGSTGPVRRANAAASATVRRIRSQASRP